MKFKYKSVIIGRLKKEKEGVYPCFFHFFKVNNPHRKNIVPEKMVDFPAIHKVFFRDLNINYLLPGNDLIINNLDYLEIEKGGNHIYVKGKQKKLNE